MNNNFYNTNSTLSGINPSIEPTKEKLSFYMTQDEKY